MTRTIPACGLPFQTVNSGSREDTLDLCRQLRTQKLHFFATFALNHYSHFGLSTRGTQQYPALRAKALFHRIDHEMQEETQHADALLRRILFLGGRPDMRPNPFTPGETVPEMLQKDLATEYEVRAALQKGMALCESVGDYVSRDLLLAQLRDTEEDHAYWLEKQLGLIDKIGLPNYLQSQMGSAAV